MIVAHFRRHQVPQKETVVRLKWLDRGRHNVWRGRAGREKNGSRCNCHCSQGSLTRWHWQKLSPPEIWRGQPQCVSLWWAWAFSAWAWPRCPRCKTCWLGMESSLFSTVWGDLAQLLQVMVFPDPWKGTEGTQFSSSGLLSPATLL